MKKLVILSMTLLFVVSLGFALKPVPVTTIKQTTNTVKKIGSVSSTTLSKTNAGTVVTKTEGTALPNETGVTLEDPGVPSTTAGKTANTGTSKVVLPGSSRVVPSTTVGGRDLTVDKGEIKGGTNPVAKEDDGNPSTTFSIADYMPTTGSKTQVTNPVIGNSKTVGKTTLKTGTQTQDVIKR